MDSDKMLRTLEIPLNEVVNINLIKVTIENINLKIAF